MNNLNKLSNSFEDTIKDTDLQNVSIELAETFTDTVLNDGLLREIPIISTIIGLTKASFNLNERLLIKKLIYFIAELKNIDVAKRQKLISNINSSDNKKIRIGEKLLYIIDKCDDHIISKYIAIIFSSFLREEISYNDFLRCSTIIQKLLVQDIEQFINTKIEDIEIKVTKYDKGIPDFHGSLINSGICTFIIDNVSVSDQDDWKANEKYKIDGGDILICLTNIGRTLKTILKYCG